jgi:GMP synthase (glutamine-hydrolysing)
MATPRTRLRLVLLQVRNELVSLKQEQSCFIERCRVARRQFDFINLVDNPEIRWHHVKDAHAVLIGGAGAFSVTREHPFTAPLRDVIQRVIEDGRPVFGACWGHQFLADLGGGTVIEDKERSEVGTFPIRLTEAGKTDPLFAEFPERFHVQLGHNDRVSELGSGWLDLAQSEACPRQIIRLDDKPIYGTQEAYQKVLRSLRPSIEADRLLELFLERYA